MAQLSKRIMAITLMQAHEELFACPICAGKMTMSDAGTLRCTEQHSFDVAKQGMVHLLPRAVASMYSKELFEARHEVVTSGLYDKVQQKIADLLVDAPLILDTGCGEGSHLARICAAKPGAVGVGIDIAKEGILTAAKNYAGFIWCVGDLANSPYSEGSFDTILNFLSPANYEEFKRLLKPGGQVIKVVPQENYLKELRLQAFADSEKEAYSNAQTVARFKENFDTVEIHRVTYTMPLDVALVPKLLEMTPMGWHIKDRTQIALTEITIDLDILVGA
ncbi:MAG: putative RNA methyltransferase [Solibacillus sp.]